ncbi:MAG: hypothetical protein BM562_05425 [Alphaproteobacteria bacterium MedPE-SWcel]|nr:MAG: hypothetical protein BM562_05425 [Alphaproteobacteria bacterium MedPE-SWcel]
MAKVIVEFLKTHGRYVKGDVAGFEAATLAKWPQDVCRPYDADASATVEPQHVDSSEAQKAIAEAQAEFERKGDELAAREADLKAREEALAAREAAQSPDPAPEKTAPAGAPPKQGAKT